MSIGQTAEIAFEVTGAPPIKNEALSLFSMNHKQRDRVTALLTTAADAVKRVGWTVATGHISLEVIVRSTADGPAGDATNHLGGIADVGCDRRRRLQAAAAHGDVDRVARACRPPADNGPATRRNDPTGGRRP